MLASLHIGIDIGIAARVKLFLGLVFRLFHLLATQPLEEVSHLLVVQRVRQVLRSTLETTEATSTILCVVAYIRIAVLVQVVGVGGKDCIHIKGIALRQFQTQSHGEVTPRLLLSGKVIAHVSTQLVNDADFLNSRGVGIALYLHLDIVGNIHRYRTRLATRHAIHLSGEGRILYQRYVAVGIGLLVSIIVSIAAGSEVGGIVERDGGLEDVAHCLNLLTEEFAVGDIEAIQCRRSRHRHTPVVDVIETLQGVHYFLLVLRVP